MTPPFLNEMRQAALEAERLIAVQKEQLRVATETRKRLEEELQTAKTERARAIREREAAVMAAQTFEDEVQSVRYELEKAQERIVELEKLCKELEASVNAKTLDIIRLMPFEPQTQARFRSRVVDFVFKTKFNVFGTLLSNKNKCFYN